MSSSSDGSAMELLKGSENLADLSSGGDHTGQQGEPAALQQQVVDHGEGRCDHRCGCGGTWLISPIGTLNGEERRCCGGQRLTHTHPESSSTLTTW